MTAVPPTPPPPPIRDAGGPATTPLHNEEERTLPTGAHVDQTRWVRNDIPDGAPAPLSVQPSMAPRPDHLAAVTLNPLGGSAPTERVPANYTPATSSVSATPQVTPQVNQDRGAAPAPAPPPAPVTSAPIDEAMEETVDEEPVKKSKKRKRAAAHNPSGDMGLALFGAIITLLGIGILGLTSVIDASGVLYFPVIIGSLVVTAISVGAAVTTVLVLMTSGRGRKPAKKGLAIVLGILAALLLAGWPAFARLGLDASATGFAALGNFGDMMASTTPMDGNLPTEPAPPPADPTAGDDGTVPAPDAGAPDEPPVADVEAGDDGAADADSDTAAEAGSSSETTTGSSSANTGSTSRTGRTSPTRVTPTRRIGSGSSDRDPPPEPDLSDAEEKDLDDFALDDDGPSSPPPPKSNLPSTPPLAAVDVLIKSNVKVKKCFYDENKRAGGLPAKVDMRFTIKGNGDATGISLKQSKYPELESCLIKAVRDIGFPSSQNGTTLTFPFVLR